MTCVYLISTGRRTYVGATTDLTRRLRQHNGELVGGARATHARVALGERWSVVCHVENFPDWTSALQFEWMWKFLTRRQTRRASPVARRMRALERMLASGRSTSKSAPFSAWARPPTVVPRAHGFFCSHA